MAGIVYVLSFHPPIAFFTSVSFSNALIIIPLISCDLPPFLSPIQTFSSPPLSLFLSQTCWSAAAVTSLATVLSSDWTLGHVARQQQ